MFSAFEKALNASLLFLGALLLPRAVYDATDSSALYWLTVAFIVGVVLWFYARDFMASLFNWRLGYKRFPTPGFIGRRVLAIDIAPDYAATISRTSEHVFLRTPSADDLVDVMDSLPGHTVEQRHYRSDDATIEDVAYRKGALKVFWKPKDGEILPLVPYQHHMSYVSPSRYGDDGFYHANYFDRDVGLATFTVSAPSRVSEAVAFMLPFWQSGVTGQRLYDHYIAKPRRGCEQPVISMDGRTVEWTLTRPKRGRVYILFCVYAGMTDPQVVNGELVFSRALAGATAETVV